VIGRFVRPRLKGVFQRDEAMQARELADTLDELERSEVAGALLSTFVTPGSYTDDDPRYDLDMDSMSLVKSLPDGRHGIVYPDMPWSPRGVRRGGAPLRQSLPGVTPAHLCGEAARVDHIPGPAFTTPRRPAAAVDGRLNSGISTTLEPGQQLSSHVESISSVEHQCGTAV